MVRDARQVVSLPTPRVRTRNGAPCDAVDEVAELGDFFGCWCGFRFRPVLEVGGGHNSFPVGQKLLQVGLQFRQVRGVAAEVAAADAGELVGAGVAAGFDIGGFGADSERHGYLADAEPAVFLCGQVVNLVKYAASLPVKLLQGNLFHGATYSDFGDAVVTHGGLHRAMTHQVPQHVGGGAAVGVPLGVTVPVAVGHNNGGWEWLYGVVAEFVGDLVDELSMPVDHSRLAHKVRPVVGIDERVFGDVLVMGLDRQPVRGNDPAAPLFRGRLVRVLAADHMQMGAGEPATQHR